uniref:Uncharacterized protein n=1 Tax=Rhizophora mucronata TaxID=61149 RepID=A0A2P2L3D7_RHIMU
MLKELSPHNEFLNPVEELIEKGPANCHTMLTSSVKYK